MVWPEMQKLFHGLINSKGSAVYTAGPLFRGLSVDVSFIQNHEFQTRADQAAR
jgi:hypothetical protein